MKVLSVSSGRADLGILAPVWRALAARGGVELYVLLTGAHVTDDSAARAALPPGVAGHTAGADMAGGSGGGAAAAMAAIVDAAACLAAELEPARALITGDRLDMLPAALGLVPLNIPLVHLHGGELTYGALDERVRHAMSKLAHLHCTATAKAAARLVRMGEEPWHIRVTGAPGLDTLMDAPVMDASVFSRKFGFVSVAGLRLVTVHPETNTARPLAVLDATLAALAAVPGPILFTAPNADPGGAEALSRIEAFVASHDEASFRATLGPDLYPNALRHASVMVGNSSSGLIEAGLFGLPAINIGARQEGRLRGGNVIDCDAAAGEVEKLLRNPPPRFAPGSPYGDGASAPRIADWVIANHDRDRLLYKRFAAEDIQFTAPWEAPEICEERRSNDG